MSRSSDSGQVSLERNVEVLRVYDPDRRPSNWTDIIRPGQLVVFSKHIDTDGPCDAAGVPFASSSDVTCLLFDRLSDARTFCDEQVARAPAVCFEIFDSAGRINPPLVTVVHPSRAPALAGNPRGIRIRKRAAIALLLGAPVLFWFDWKADGLLILPTFLGINMLIAAARLIQLNASYSHTERIRVERLARHDADAQTGPPRDARPRP